MKHMNKTQDQLLEQHKELMRYGNILYSVCSEDEKEMFRLIRHNDAIYFDHMNCRMVVNIFEVK